MGNIKIDGCYIDTMPYKVIVSFSKKLGEGLGCFKIRGDSINDNISIEFGYYVPFNLFQKFSNVIRGYMTDNRNYDKIFNAVMDEVDEVYDDVDDEEILDEKRGFLIFLENNFFPKLKTIMNVSPVTSE